MHFPARVLLVGVMTGLVAGLLSACLGGGSGPANGASVAATSAAPTNVGSTVVAQDNVDAQSAPGPNVKDAGDTAIQWQSLPAGGTSDLAGIGGDVYVVVSPPEGASILYRLAEGNRIPSAVATIPSETVTSLTAINGKLLVAGDQSLALVDPATGSATTVELKTPPGLESKAPVPPAIAAVAAIGTRAYIVEYDSNELQVVETSPALAVLPSILLPSTMEAPGLIAAIGSGRLLVSQPYTFFGDAPSTVVVDPGTGASTPLPGVALGEAAVSGGRVLSAEVGQAGIVDVTGGNARTTALFSGTVTGANDLIAESADGTVWIAPGKASALMSEDAAGHDQRYLLPVFEGVSSRGGPAIQFNPEITSMVGLSGSGVAVLGTAGTTRVGFIAGDQ